MHARTGAGDRQLVLTARDGGRYTFRAAMGHPKDVRQETLSVAGESLVVATLDIGNPQCVALMDRLPDRARFERLGPGLATHARFPAGTNVEFAVVEAPDRVRILIWERGVGPTEASGTGACAAAVTAMSLRRRGARRRRALARGHAARGVDRRGRVPHRLGRDPLRRGLAALADGGVAPAKECAVGRF